MANEGNDMESKQAVKETLTTDLTRRLVLTFLRAGCAVTGEPLGAKELEAMDPVDRRGIEAGIEAVVTEFAGMGVESFPSDESVADHIADEFRRAPLPLKHFDISAKAAGALIKAFVAPVLAAKDAELAQRDRKIADLEEHAAYVTGWRQEAEARARAAKQETDKSVKSANEWRLVAELADEIKNAAIKETETLRAKLSELAKATPDGLVPSPDEITRMFLIRTYGTVDDDDLSEWRKDAIRLRDAILNKVAPAFNAQREELERMRVDVMEKAKQGKQTDDSGGVGKQMFAMIQADDLRQTLYENRARESITRALDEAGIKRSQTTMDGKIQRWTLPERVGMLIVRDRETRMDLERVTEERDALKQQTGEAWLKSIDTTNVEIERNRLAKEVEELRATATGKSLQVDILAQDLGKMAPAFNAQREELAKYRNAWFDAEILADKAKLPCALGRLKEHIDELTAERDSDRKWLVEYRAREKSMNHALDEAGIERDQTTMQGTLQFWTLPERVGLLIVRDRETRMDLERVTAERDALKTEAGEAWLKSIDATHIEIERDRLAKEVEDLRGELNVAELALVEWAESTKSPAPSVASKLIVHLRTSRDAANASLSEASDEILKLHQHLIDVRREAGLNDGWNSAPWSELPKRIAAKAKVDSAYIKIVELERDDAKTESKRIESNLDAAFRSLGLETKARKQAEDERCYTAQRLDDARFFLRTEREAHAATRAKLAEATKAAPVVAAQRWEYKVTTDELRLNEEGTQGWELVTATVHVDGMRMFHFRRPVST